MVIFIAKDLSILFNVSVVVINTIFNRNVSTKVEETTPQLFGILHNILVIELM